MSDVRSSAAPAFLALDTRVPATLRDLLVEADGCLKSGFLTGATACAQRAVQTLLKLEDADGGSFQARLRSLSDKYPAVAQVLFAVLMHFGDETVPDESKLDAHRLQLLTVTLKAVMYEIYVLGPERTERIQYVRRLLESLEGNIELEQSGSSTSRLASSSSTSTSSTSRSALGASSSPTSAA
jgi:hypothetical protein